MINTNHFVGRQKTVFDALFERVGINRRAKIVGVGNRFGLFGRRGQTDLAGARKVIQISRATPNPPPRCPDDIRPQ